MMSDAMDALRRAHDLASGDVRIAEDLDHVLAAVGR